MDDDVWELFNLKKDFSQSTNLADEYPKKLAELKVLTSSEVVPSGKSDLRMKFTRTGDFEGDAELFINGKSVGKTHIDKTVPVTYSIEEAFDVGEDTGSPIIEDVYAVPFRNEALLKLTVKIDKNL